MRNKKFAIIPLLIVGAVALFQYFGVDKVIKLETGKSTRGALSPQQEETLGLQSCREVLFYPNPKLRTVYTTPLLRRYRAFT